jgi:hypothetical protein
MPPVGALGYRETAHLAAPILPSSVRYQQLGIALFGKSLLVTMSQLLDLDCPLSLFSRLLTIQGHERSWANSLKHTSKYKSTPKTFLRTVITYLCPHRPQTRN